MYTGPLANRFSLSADGTRAAGEFPWPCAGMLYFRTGQVDRKNYRNGCNSYISPDDSHMATITHHRPLPTQSGFELFRDAIAQAFRGQHLYVRHPRKDPTDYLLAAGGLEAHLDATVPPHMELLRRVPLSFRDVDREFRLEQESDFDGFLSPGDPKGVLRV